MLYTETIQISLPGLRERKTFIHISDAHLAYAAPTDSPEVRALAKQQSDCWAHGDSTPTEQFLNILSHAKEQNADALLLTGDILDYIMQSNLAYLRNTLATCAIPSLYVFGNHEPCTEEPPSCDVTGSSPYYESYADMMFGSPAFWAVDFEDFLVVGMDNSAHTVTEEQIKKLQEQFLRGLPIILLLHIPLYNKDICGPIEKTWGPDSADYFTFGGPSDTPQSRDLCALLQAKDCPVTAIFAGHIHTACESEFAPGKKQYTAAPAFQGYLRRVELVPA